MEKIRARLQEIASWHPRVVTNPKTLLGVEKWMEDKYPKHLPWPNLYANDKGGIRAEIMIGEKDISLDFDFQKNFFIFHSLDFETHEEHYQEGLVLAEIENLLSLEKGTI